MKGQTILGVSRLILSHPRDQPVESGIFRVRILVLLGFKGATVTVLDAGLNAGMEETKFRAPGGAISTIDRDFP